MCIYTLTHTHLNANHGSYYLAAYAIISTLCITSHLKASTMNPGKVPYYVGKDSTGKYSAGLQW